MDKYVFILELLVSKNLDKLDRRMTEELLKIYKIDSLLFNKMMFYKLLKILAHLHFLREVSNPEQIDDVLEFMGSAYHNTKDQLSFLFVMKVLLMITKDTDNSNLFNSSTAFK
jgi:hypothetical protein